MGADWYTCLTFYGYKINVPDGMTYKKFVNTLNEINEFLQEPYKITGLLQNFHSRMESASDYDLQSLDKSASIIIGFQPQSNLEMLLNSINDLKEYVTDNHYLMGLELEETPKFYSGIEWFTNIYYEYVSDDDDEGEDDDEEDDDEEDDEEGEDEEGEDEVSSDEDEFKIAPLPSE